jgi:hypothetical protein
VLLSHSARNSTSVISEERRENLSAIRNLRLREMVRAVARRPGKTRNLTASLVLTLLGSLMIVLGAASPALADPVCQQGGAYVLFARGSGQSLNDSQARAFRDSVMAKLAQKGVGSAWAELGNEDGSVDVPSNGTPRMFPDANYEYPAVRVDDWHNPTVINGQYAQSVTIGKNELVTHLNDRYAGNGPKDNGSCANETLILGGYSQGADVVGWALRSSELSQAVKDHIGYVALYGDPKFNPGSIWDRLFRINFQSNWWWVRGNDAGLFVAPPSPATGILGGRDPYVANEFKGRFGSWCSSQDAICANWWPIGLDIHSNEYQNRWIPQSADEIVYVAKLKRDQLLNGGGGNSSALPYVTAPPTAAEPQPRPSGSIPVEPLPLPKVFHVKRALAPDGRTREVYASTVSAVTEAWWQPGGDGVHTDELIHIAQDNIVGFDKANMPDGVTQAVYTAVPDGVWETWWNASHSPTSAKIVTGLSGVRQVIVANAYEGSQFVHRLYLLAQDGPYEVWWKDGGDGVHVSRLNNITGAVTMVAGNGPDGAYEVFVATPTWVYQLWWFPGGAVNNRTILNVTQGDIRSLNMGANLNGGQLLYTGTSTTAWQSWWLGDNGAISTGTIATGQTNAIEVEKDVYNGVHELYLATGDHVQEYWWNGPNSGGGELIRITQNNITSFDKSDDGAAQQIYTASGDIVYETWWAAGVSPTSSVLFKVAR